jgi:hypothetical protein
MQAGAARLRKALLGSLARGTSPSRLYFFRQPPLVKSGMPPEYRFETLGSLALFHFCGAEISTNPYVHRARARRGQAYGTVP